MINMSETTQREVDREYEYRLACPFCEIEMQRYMEHNKYVDKFCPRCGRELIKWTPPPPQKTEIIPFEKLPLGDLTTFIVETLYSLTESEKEEANQKIRERNKVFEKEDDYHNHMVKEGNIYLFQNTTNGVSYITVNHSDQSKNSITIAEYILKEEDAHELWDDLTDILLIPAHPTMKLRFFKEFSVKDKPYRSKIKTIKYEGGYLLAY